MTRREKYPETGTFHFYNANPKNKFTTDCVIRALSTALEIPYNQVVMELAELQCKTGYDACEKKAYDMYLKSKGWVKRSQPIKVDDTKFTGEEFCNYMYNEAYTYWSTKSRNQHKRMIANIGGHHVVAIINFKVYDTWNSTDGCIGNYWVKEN